MNYHNKWTIGKHLSKIKKNNQTVKQPTLLQLNQQLLEYRDYLIQQGVQYNKIEFGQFYTKNDLPYMGFIAKEKILTNETFMKIPVHLILNTKKAFYSEIQIIFREHPYFFSSDYHDCWEDNILWAFLLFENQKGKQSQWFHMLNNLSKNIDYLAFWNENDQNQIEDNTLLDITHRYQNDYEKDYNSLKKILSQYPQYFTIESFCPDNARWIYIHLVSRLFGRYFAYVSMVPFAEFLNHENTNVSYEFDYNEDNKNKPKDLEEKPLPKESTEEELYDYESSDCSNRSWLDDNDSDYDYEINNEQQKQKQNIQQCQQSQVQTETMTNLIEISNQKQQQQIQSTVNLVKQTILQQNKINPKLLNEIDTTIKDIEFWMFNQLNMGDSFTIFFAAQIYDELKILREEFYQGQSPYYVTKNRVRVMQTQNFIFKNYMYKYLSCIKKKLDQQPQQKQERILFQHKNYDDFELNPKKQYYPLDNEWAEDKFDYVIMKTSEYDQFEANSQVYFCYGRLSNRALLSRYGFALEHNKYDHAFIKLEYIQLLKDYEVINEKLNSWKTVSKYKVFKIKRRKFNIDLLFFVRAKYWSILTEPLEKLFWIYDKNIDFEIKCLLETIEIYQQFEKTNFSKSLEENERLLYDKSINYHEYFATIYRLERQRIIRDQIKLANIAIEILRRVKEKDISIEYAALLVPQYEKQDEMPRNRVMLIPFFDRYQQTRTIQIKKNIQSLENQDIEQLTKKISELKTIINQNDQEIDDLDKQIDQQQNIKVNEKIDGEQ